MNELLIITLGILAVPAMIGLLIGIALLCSLDGEDFWKSKWRFVVLIFYPIIIIIGVVGGASSHHLLSAYSDHQGFTNRKIELMLFSSIGVIIGTIILYAFITMK